MITCANCQSNNPDNAQVCQNCGQPLTTGSDIQEVSPPWLLNLLNKYGVSQGVLVGTADVFIAPGGTETEFDDDRPDDISDVLQDIAQDSPRPQTGRLASSVDWGPAGEAQSAPDDPVDDVLSGFQPEVAEPVEDYNAEDWLSELAASTSPKPSDEPGFTPPALPADEATDEFSDTPDWLDELSRASEAPHRAEISSAQPAAPDQSKLEIPDWLRDSDDFEAQTPPAAESDFPAGRSGQSSSVEDDSPDWMSELGDSGSAADEETTLVPDWLMEFAASDDEVSPESPAGQTFEAAIEADESEEMPPARPAIEIPDWLAELDASREAEKTEAAEEPAVEPEATRLPTEQPANEEAFDWLADLGLSTAEEEIAPDESAAAEVEAPAFDFLLDEAQDQSDDMVEEPDPDTAWLAELTMHLPDDPDAGQQEVGSATWSGEPAQLEEDESEGANLEIDSMPDWLKSSWDEETSEEEDETEVEASLPSLPDWLTDADDQDAADEEAASDDLDWLSSLRQSETPMEMDLSETESSDLSAMPSWLTDEDELADQPGAVTDLDWLASLRQAETPAEAEASDLAEADEEPFEFPSLPSQAVGDIDYETFEAEPDLSEAVIEPDEAETAMDSEMDLGGPDWLSQLEQIDTDEVAESALAEAVDDSSALDLDSDEPEWLREVAADADKVIDSLQIEENEAAPDWTPSFDESTAEPATAEEVTAPEDRFRLESTAESPASTPERAAETGEPDWLRRLEGQAQQETVLPLSDWLDHMKQFQGQDATRAHITEATDTADEVEAADWAWQAQPSDEPTFAESALEAPAEIDLTPSPLTDEAPAEDLDSDADDWMTTLRVETGTPALTEAEAEMVGSLIDEEPAADDADVPDWMSALESTSEAETSLDLSSIELEAEPTAAEDDTLDWLSGLAADTAIEAFGEEEEVTDELDLSAAEETLVDEAEDDADTPDWLLAMQVESDQTTFVETDTAAHELSLSEPVEVEEDEAEVPDWLVEMQTGQADAEAEISEPAAEAEADTEDSDSPFEVPAWMMTDTTPEAPFIEVESSEADEADDADDWLSGLRGGRLQFEEAVVDEASDETPLIEDVPDWMSGLDDSEESPTADADAASDLDWLRGLRQGMVEVEPEVESDTSRPLSEDVPDWMKDLDVEIEQPDDVVVEDDSASDWLSELRITSTEPDRVDNEDQESVGDLPDLVSPLDVETLDDEETPAPAAFEEVLPEPVEEPDWLTSLRSGTSDAAAESEDETDDLPFDTADLDWIKALDRQSALDRPSAPSGIDDEVSDWLSDLQVDTSPPDIFGSEESESALAEETPDWLKDLDSETTTDEDTDKDDDSDDPDGGSGDALAWLSSLGNDTGTDTSEADIPDWLKDSPEDEDEDEDNANITLLAATAGAAALLIDSDAEAILDEADEAEITFDRFEAGDEVVSAAQAEETFNWTADPGTELIDSETTIADRDELPAWMQGLEDEDVGDEDDVIAFETGLNTLPTVVEPLDDAALPIEVDENEEELTADEVKADTPLDRLSQLTQSPAETETPPERKPRKQEGVLDWMLETINETEDESLSWIFDSSADSEVDLVGDQEEELPDWLPAVVDDSPSDQVLTEAETVLPFTEPTPERSTVSGLFKGGAAAASTAAQTFFDIATAVPRAPVVPEKTETVVSQRGRIIRAALSFGFLILIALPLFFPLNRGGYAVPWLEPSDAEQQLVQNGLQGVIGDKLPGSVALVSFDYTPATDGEMKPLALQIVRKLRGQDMRVIGMTLEPEGQGMIEDIFSAVGSADDADRFVNLGYQPGGPLAVRRLAFGDLVSSGVDLRTGQAYQDLTDWPEVNQTNGIDLIVEIGATADSSRWWAEQLASVAGPPKLAVVSAAAEPFVIPYVSSGQYAAVVAGIRGAAAIESERVQPTLGMASRMLDSQSIAHVTIMILMLAGTMAGLFARYGQEAA